MFVSYYYNTSMHLFSLMAITILMTTHILMAITIQQYVRDPLLRAVLLVLGSYDSVASRCTEADAVAIYLAATID